VDHPVAPARELAPAHAASPGGAHSQAICPGAVAGGTGRAAPKYTAHTARPPAEPTAVADHPAAVASTTVSRTPSDAVDFSASTLGA
jgi:hypothetical protein